MEVLKRIFSNPKYVRRITMGFLTVVFAMISFLVVNLIIMYNRYIKPQNEEVKLIYEFGPNTIEYESFNDSNFADISEKFLSYGISYGIDVSEWQGNIDWDRVRATGISFAMIRCGFRQIDGSEVIEDAMFRQNMEGAIRAGLKVGVYFYGTAKNEIEALEEAEFTIDLIKDYNLTYPVVYDVETFNNGRLKNVSYSTITDNVLMFTETVSSYGYETMVYSYHNALTYYLDMGKLDGKLIWLAHFADKTDYKGNYSMWQYSETGRVDGINTNVDLNISYFNYVDSEEEIVPNPNYVTAPEVEFEPRNETVKTTTKSTLRSTPTNQMPNRMASIPRNTEMIRTGYSKEFSRVIYNGRTVYISNSEIRLVS